MNQNKKIRFHLTLLCLVFLFPVIAGWIIYHYHAHFNFKTSNHGTLINPPISATYLYHPTTTKLWRIVYLPKQCDAQCKAIYFKLGQVKKALGKESQRVTVLLLDSVPDHLINQLQQDLTHATQHAFTVQDKIYLLDPLGNLFMYYASQANLMDVLKDMKKVLEVSQIG